MFKMTPQHAEGDPAYVLNILTDVAEALSAVFGSSDQDLLDAPDVRSGFMYITMGMRQSLAELSSVVEDRMAMLRSIEAERDGLKAQLATAEGTCDYVLSKYGETPGVPPLDVAEAAAFMRRRKEGAAPDLSEPAPPVASGDAALAG